MPSLGDDDYRSLLEFRDGLRRFQRWSEKRAAAAGLTPAQHQLLLAVRGHSGHHDPTIGDVAEHLQLRHHSAVGLVNRAEAAGLVRRWADSGDQRLVRLTLTSLGRRRLEELSQAHLDELRRVAPQLRSVWVDLDLEPITGAP